METFLEKLMDDPEVKPLLSDDHFSVDGSLLQAWASHASQERIDGQEDPPPAPAGPGEGFGDPREGKKRAKGDFRGIKLCNETHSSSKDPVGAVLSEGVAMLARKSNAHPAQQSYRDQVFMDNHHTLVVDCRVTPADGHGVDQTFLSMEPFGGIVQLIHVGRGAHYGVDRARGSIHPGVAAHPQKPLLVLGHECISRPLSFSLLLVELGAAMIVASRIVPSLSFSPFSLSI